jgi:hypothetical protein
MLILYRSNIATDDEYEYEYEYEYEKGGLEMEEREDGGVCECLGSCGSVEGNEGTYQSVCMV